MIIHFQLGDDQEEVWCLLWLQNHTDASDKSLHDLEYILVFILETCGQEVAHVDDDSLLGSEIVLESGLTTSGALDLSAEWQSIEF